MAFEQMPNEIVRQIFLCCENKELSTVSRICQRFREVAEPILYSSVDRIESSALLQLLETLIDKPHLAQFIRDVTLLDTGNPLDSEVSQRRIAIMNKARIKKFKQLLEQYANLCQEHHILPDEWPYKSARLFVQDWTKNMTGREFSFGKLGALLLLLLPNLQRLKLINYHPGQAAFQYVFSISSRMKQLTGQTIPAKTPGLLSNLQEVDFDTHPYYSQPLIQVLPLLQLPHIQKLALARLTSAGSIPVPKFLQPLKFSHLVLLDLTFTPDILDKILPHCPNLTILTITYNSHEDESRNSNYNRRLITLVQSITHLSDHLQQLSFLSYHLRSSDQGEEFPFLNQFQKLRILSIEGDTICQARISIPGSLFNFSDLPPNLTHLNIRNPDRARIVLVLEHNIQHLSFVPHLRSIHVMLTHIFLGDDNGDDRDEDYPLFGDDDMDIGNVSNLFAQKGLTLSFAFGPNAIKDCAEGLDFDGNRFIYNENPSPR